ncbi:MAG: amidohydrolase family protein [Candidatus Poribacteria bacterium]|nr:amidohydrolase family protein [Candidatus Poribacteria bacterium]
MADFPIVDTHIHLWDPNVLRYPWLEDTPFLNKPYLLEDYRKACGPIDVDTMVFVQCDTHPDDSLKEAEWVASLAKVDARLKGIVAWAPLETGEGARAHLEKLTENPAVKGIRRLIQSESLEFCLQSDFIKGVQMLEEFGLSFDICIYHPHLANTIEFVKQCPNVQFILDHIGKPDIKNQLFEPWKREIKTLSSLPNVHCKVSGLVTEADFEKWTPEDLKPYIDHVIDCFGFDRAIYGSDWPVAAQATEYPRWVETLARAVEGCSDDELGKLFHDNAIRFYRLS